MRQSGTVLSASKCEFLFRHERKLRREILEKQQSEYNMTAEALNEALSQKIEDHKNNQSTQLPPTPFTHLIKEEKKSASQPLSFGERQAQFCSRYSSSIRATISATLWL